MCVCPRACVSAASVLYSKQDAKSPHRADPWDFYYYFSLVNDLFSETGADILSLPWLCDKVALP